MHATQLNFIAPLTDTNIYSQNRIFKVTFDNFIEFVLLDKAHRELGKVLLIHSHAEGPQRFGPFVQLLDCFINFAVTPPR